MADPMTPEALAAYVKLAENIRERFGDHWQLVDDEDMGEVSVRTEDSTLGLFTEMFVTGQVHGEDPLEVAGFLAAAIDNVPRMAAMIRQVEAERDDAMAGWKKADTEADQARAALAKTQDHRAYLQERLGKVKKEAAGRKAHGERLRAALAVQTEQREIARATAEGLRAELATATREHRRNTLAAEAALDRIESLIGDRQQAERDAGEAIGRADKAEAERDEAREQVAQLRTLLRDMTDPDPCSFDHHGGCQAHGYLSLKPGEKCPHAEAKELLAGQEAGQ